MNIILEKKTAICTVGAELTSNATNTSKWYPPHLCNFTQTFFKKHKKCLSVQNLTSQNSSMNVLSSPLIMNISRSDGYYKPDLPPWVVKWLLYWFYKGEISIFRFLDCLLPICSFLEFSPSFLLYSYFGSTTKLKQWVLLLNIKILPFSQFVAIVKNRLQPPLDESSVWWISYFSFWYSCWFPSFCKVNSIKYHIGHILDWVWQRQSDQNSPI